MCFTLSRVFSGFRFFREQSAMLFTLGLRLSHAWCASVRWSLFSSYTELVSMLPFVRGLIVLLLHRALRRTVSVIDRRS